MRTDLLARIALLEQNLQPFVVGRPYLFNPGVVPANLPVGLHRMDHTSLLFRQVQNDFRTGGICRGDGRLPVVGFRLVEVDAIVRNEFQTNIFVGRMQQLRVFRDGADAEVFNQVLSPDQLEVLEYLRGDRKGVLHEAPAGDRKVRTFYCYHGCRQRFLNAICTGGLVNLAGQNDRGYYGAGVYTTLNIELAARYAGGDFGGDWIGPGTIFPVVMFAACVGTAYPITRARDYTEVAAGTRADGHSDRYGLPLQRGFDCHMACVSEANAFESVQHVAQTDYVEVVFEQQHKLVPMAVLWVERT